MAKTPKGWKRIKSDMGKGSMEFVNIHNRSHISIYDITVEFPYKEIHKKQKWMVEYGIGNRTFKTKREAINFATKLMREHPRG